jgi:hypothetical protein
MSLVNRVPAVCAALRSQALQASCGIELEGWSGPEQGATATATFRILAVDRTNRPSNDLEAEAEEDLESAPVTLDEKLQWRRFQEVARKVMARHFNEDLHERAIPDVSKRFDMVSSDGSVVGDAKYLSLVRGKTRPPAKFMEIAGHIWLLEKTNAKRIFLVFGNQRDVASLWLKKYGTVAGRVEMYFVDSEGKLDRLH